MAEKIAAITNPPPVDATVETTVHMFRPDDIFYDAPAGKYLVKVGRSYFIHGRKGPVVTGLVRYFAPLYSKASEVSAAAVSAIQARELDGGVQWTGTIAGHKQGLATDMNGLPILITSEANPPVPSKGNADLISEIITSALTDTTAAMVFMSWLAGRYKCVRDHVHVPSPMLVLAGEVNSGKSLLAWIVAQVLGGLHRAVAVGEAGEPDDGRLAIHGSRTCSSSGQGRAASRRRWAMPGRPVLTCSGYFCSSSGAMRAFTRKTIFWRSLRVSTVFGVNWATLATYDT